MNSPITVNDNRLASRYNGFDLTVTKRQSNGTDADRLHLLDHEVDMTSLANPNNAFVNAGETTAAAQLQGERIMRSAGILFGSRVPLEFRLADHADVECSSCSATILTNCAAGHLLHQRRAAWQRVAAVAAHARRARRQALQGDRQSEPELSLDVYNLTNANTTFDVRRTTSLTSIRPAGDPNAPVQSIASWMSPISVLSPRVARINATYRF